MKRFWSLATVAAFVVGGTLACGSGAPEGIPDTKPTGQEQTAHWPDSLERFRFHWSSSPGLALTTGVAVPVRAYLESWYIASWTNGPENVYPGFLRATPESADLDGNYLGQLAWIRPLNGAPPYPVDPAKPLGYMPMHIQSVDAVASGLRVTVCLGEYSIYFASDSSAGKLVSVAADKSTAQLADPLDTVRVKRIELTKTDPRIPAGASDVDTPQEGPAPAPVGDVFGHWFITGASSSLWGPVEAKPRPDFFVTPEMRRQCQEAMPDSPERQIEMATGFKDNPPPHGQPIPGWPLAPQ